MLKIFSIILMVFAMAILKKNFYKNGADKQKGVWNFEGQ